MEFLLQKKIVHSDIGVDFGGSPSVCPPKIGKCPFIYQFLLPSKIWVYPPNILDKSMPVHSEVCTEPLCRFLSMSCIDETNPNPDPYTPS